MQKQGANLPARYRLLILFWVVTHGLDNNGSGGVETNRRGSLVRLGTLWFLPIVHDIACVISFARCIWRLPLVYALQFILLVLIIHIQKLCLPAAQFDRCLVSRVCPANMSMLLLSSELLLLSSSLVNGLMQTRRIISCRKGSSQSFFLPELKAIA